MRCKTSIVFILFFVLFPSFGLAQEGKEEVLIVYTSADTETPGSVWMLDSLVSHFDVSIKLVRDTEVTEEMMSHADRFIYYGRDDTVLSPVILKGSEKFSGKLALIGKNAEQFPLFEGKQVDLVSQVTAFTLTRTKKEVSLSKVVNVYAALGVSEKDRVLLSGRMNDYQFPIIFQNDKVFYAGMNRLTDKSSYFLADALHDFFHSTHEEKHVGYIRLEDVSPVSDEKKLREAGQYLIDRNIPFLMAVIPVYVNPETAEKMYLSDKPKLVETIRYLQEHGGNVIAHGYTHTYRSAETGEGFEFWDVENDQFVFAKSTDKRVEKLLKPEAFATKEDYRAYIQPYLDKEQAYIEQKLQSSIDDLVRLGLPPVSFEAPHYTMSLTGYRWVSEHFTSIFGQMQLSNTTWETMGTPPYVSTPSILNGLTIYPETIGYVDVTSAMPIEAMRDEITPLLQVRDGMVGAFYHPYIGMDYLPEVITLMESIQGFEWLDIKKTAQEVKSDKSIISINEEGTVQVQSKSNLLQDTVDQIMPESWVEKVLFLLSGVVLLFVLLFTIYTFYLRTQRKKKLFKER